MDEYEKIMEICAEALEKAGYEVSDYSDCYMHFMASNHDDTVKVSFKEIN